MENISNESLLYNVEAKIKESKKDKVKLLSEDKNHPNLDAVNDRIDSLVLIKSELIKENKSNTYHLTKDEETVFLAKMAKVREENIEKYKNAKRDELAVAEERELNIINEFLPKMPTKEELKEIIGEIIDKYIISQGDGYVLSMKDMGKIKPIVTATYSTVDGGMIKDVLISRING